ncbi:MAG: LysM peptidoglycan-binding domain-containing protein [Phycisphaerales bacterium]|nr:LysM peptidoglycan-binding domain-containing protein [Phycisphaerales bacterium]
MNREQKIALIIGFAVILVVGVLVSDHLSAAQGLTLADATEGDLGRVESRPVALLPDPGSTRQAAGPVEVREQAPIANEASREYAQAEPTQSSVPGVVPGFVPVEGSDEGPLQIVLGGNNSLGDALDQASDRLAGAERSGGDSPRPLNGAFRDLGDRVAAGFRNGIPTATKLEEVTTPAGGGRGAAEPARGGERQAPQAVRHTVAKDESLYKIATKYLGNGNRWREIADANKGKVGDDGSVRQGVTLVIPNGAAPAQADKPATAKPTKPAEQAKPKQPGQAPGRGPTTYTVAKNDSLGAIAQRLMGSVRYMDEIIRANPDKIDDPDDIRVGMVLNIPARS